MFCGRLLHERDSFSFSIAPALGNYTATVYLGDLKRTSITSVYANSGAFSGQGYRPPPDKSWPNVYHQQAQLYKRTRYHQPEGRELTYADS